MKRCPECRRDYYDDTLLYCLDDGNALLEGPATASSGDEPATAILHSTAAPGEAPTRVQRQLTEQTAILPTGTGDVVRRHRGVDKRLLFAPIALAVIVLGGIFGYRYITPAKQINSIAVMPLVNASGESDFEYLSDGMTETLINSLSQLPNIAVKGRGSVFRYKGSNTEPRQIGVDLGVQAVLSGRLLKRGDSVTLSLDLVDVSTGNQIWGDQYVRKLSDIVSLQREIAGDVSNKLKTKLSGADKENLAKTYTADPEAYQLYLQGLFQWNKRTGDSEVKSREFFQKAIEKDPKYALAYVGLATSYVISDRPAEYNLKAKSAALRALELDPSLGEAHNVLANVAFYYEWDFSRAETEFKKAIELSPNYPTAHHWYGESLAALGRFDESNGEYAKAAEFDPVSMAILTDQGMAFIYARQFDRAIEHFKKLLAIDPNYVRTHYYLATAYEAKGLFQEAIDARRKGFLLDGEDPARIESMSNRLFGAVKASGANGYWQTQMELSIERAKREGNSGDAIDLAINHANLGNSEKACELLEVEMKKKRVVFVFLKVDYIWEKIRSEACFADIVRRVGVPT
ncbi:MAG TPA: tetratricopeptide repeat protein [Pyrinomonadaceae bacterium]|nr:tetratricopeptide repeat protein [Pyrinomonadaceae bacterium]